MLQKLVKEKKLINIGYGVYTRSRISRMTGNLVTDEPLPWLAREFLKKRGIKVVPTKYQRDQKAGRCSQVPTGNHFGVDRRVSRKLSFGEGEISYKVIR